jgi:hypothetical protein
LAFYFEVVSAGSAAFECGVETVRVCAYSGAEFEVAEAASQAATVAVISAAERRHLLALVLAGKIPIFACSANPLGSQFLTVGWQLLLASGVLEFEVGEALRTGFRLCSHAAWG